MDEYTLEINELRRRIAKLKFDRGPLDVIEELEAQLRILKAIYDATWALFQMGEGDARLVGQFTQLGFGAWTFDNVYYYVYEEAVNLDPAGHDLASRISEHDYRAPLMAPVSREESTGA
ncbi:MAG TPA: hypothetical protein VET65_03840 [Candidatus Limnocylindrales bacterium]|nr:hypothetical protein [Candidatus Limnocylindrales bacterium]